MNAEIDTVIEATQQTEEEVKKFRGMKISIQCYNLLLLIDVVRFNAVMIA